MSGLKSSLLPPRARGAAQAQTPLGRSSERSARLAKAWQRVAGLALKAVHQRMQRREMALGKCIIGPDGIAQRAGSPVGPPGPMMHFCDPWSQAPPSQASFARLCFLSAWWLANFYCYIYPLRVSPTQRSFVSVSTPLISKMRTFFKNRPPWFKLL